MPYDWKSFAFVSKSMSYITPEGGEMHIACCSLCKSHSDEDTSQKGLSVLNILSFLRPISSIQFICTTFYRYHVRCE